MRITIDEPGGPRQGVSPSDGITDESSLVQSLILTLAVASINCTDNVKLRISLSGCNPMRLVEIAREVAQRGRGEKTPEPLRGEASWPT